jgi:predicted dithiol-disulfide oxidoreductase (DUF899 family)
LTKHMTGTRKEWLAARLLEAEKELTRRSDELCIGKFSRFFRANRLGLFQKTKEK